MTNVIPRRIEEAAADAPTLESEDLPARWKSTRLLDVTRHHSGNSKLIKGKLNDAPAPDLFPAFSASGQDVWRDGFEFEGEAIVVSAVGARCGKCFLASGQWSAIANTHVVWPQADKIDRKFLWYRINDERFWVRSGTAQPFVVVRKTFERPFPLPPLDEQQRIVADIEKQFTRLEAAVASLKRVQAALKRYRASVLKAACEGRLVPTEAELARRESRSYEPATTLLTRILEERRLKWGAKGRYKEPAPAKTDGLPQLPEGYLRASFGQLCRVQGGFAFKSTDYRSEGVALVRISNLVSGRVALDSDTARLPPEYAARFSDFALNKGDTLIAMSGATTGKMATMESEEPALLNQRVGRFLPASDTLCDRRFISFLVMQIGRKVLTDAYGAAQPNISPTEIEEMAVPLPPLAEQHRIVAEVERRLSVIEELEAAVAANLQRATRLRQSILQRAFSGKLLPT